MIRTLRAYFLSRLLREKILLVALAAIGVVIWFSYFSGRGGSFWRQERATTLDLKIQDQWLADRQKIEAAARKAAAQLDPAKTLDANRLYAEVRNIARDAGIRNTSNFSPAPDVTNGQFSIHTLTFTVTVGGSDADWNQLKTFYTALEQRVPYIVIDKFTLGIRGNPPQHSLTLTVFSFESAH